jgi:hypothetical protein
MVEQSALDRRANALPPKNSRVLFETSMVGLCQPFFAPGKPDPAARALTVSLYFSLDHDCLSCVKATIDQWNEVLKGPQGPRFRVTGYTDVDGTQDETILEHELKPEFPIVRVEQIEQKLKALGVVMTPVVLASDSVTGRILFASAPTAADKHDRSFVGRMQLLAAQCGG